MLTVEDLVRVMKAGDAVFALDSNAAQGKNASFRPFWELADAVGKLQQDGTPVPRVCVSALVHAELMNHIRQKRGSAFDERLAKEGLISKGVVIEAFGQTAAEGTAKHLHQQFPTGDMWQSAKKVRLEAVMNVKSAATRVPATVDWFVGGHAVSENWILVTNDKGVEFAKIERAVTFDVALKAIRSLPAAL